MKKLLVLFITLLVVLTGCFNQQDDSSTAQKSEVAIAKAAAANTNTITVYYRPSDATWIYTPTNVVNIHYNADNTGWTKAPGVATTIMGAYSGYKDYVQAVVTASSLVFCFNNNNGAWDNNGGKNYTITAPGIYTVVNGVIAPVDPCKGSAGVYLTRSGLTNPGLLYTLIGMTVTVYKNSTLYKEYVVSYAEYSNPYFQMTNLPFGTYRIVLDKYVNGVHLKGEKSFTVTSTAQSFDPIWLTVDTLRDVRVFFSYNQFLTNNLYGLKVALKKDNVLVGNYDISVANGIPETFFKDLPIGTYNVTLDQYKSGVKYTGTTAFTLITSDASVGTQTLVVTGLKANYGTMNFRGTPNSWGTTPMFLTADNTWERTVTFAAGTGEFKFTPNTDWVINYGDTNKDFTAELSGANIIVAGGATYKITFNDSTLKYSVTKQ